MPNHLRQLSHFFSQQGFGSRKECQKRIEEGTLVYLSDRHQIQALGEIHEIYPALIYIALHKPLGFECSHHPSHHPSIFTLLPTRLKNIGLQSVGRLDVETSGLLLLSNDGNWIHRLTSPKSHTLKTYRVVLKHAASQSWCEQLRTGVLLRDQPDQPVKADAIQWIDSHQFDMMIHEGRYHQVRRMVAAAGNRVEKLTRIQIGHLNLQKLNQPGNWLFINPLEVLSS
jgi:16S rRNA pseudouridine516 synthase